MFPKSWQYAIRILLHLGRLGPDEPAPARSIARATGVPAAYASKLLGRLGAAGLVRGRRGPGGGVALARAPGDITLAEVGDALGDPRPIDGCVLGFPECADANPCPIHATWGPMRERLRAELLARTLADFAALGQGRNAPDR